MKKILNRRRFVAGSVALGAGALLGRSVRSAVPLSAVAVSSVSLSGVSGTEASQTGAYGRLVVPPEESRHELTFMQWPARGLVHDEPEFLELLQGTIADIANAIAQFEPVILLAAAEEHRDARRMLSEAVTLWDVPTEDLWCRDSGPLFARDDDGRLAISHIQFNGWGNRQLHRRDGQVAARVAERLGLALVPSGLVGEAGGVEQDGHGLLLAHESSWVNENRNPGLSRDEIERRLLSAYGAQRMIWSEGVYGEDITDYHIDSLARFSGAGRVLINLPDNPDPDDPFHTAGLETYDALVAAGLELEVIPEPDPSLRRIKTPDFVASYANYYVCNGAVIAAQFGDRETDELAVEALQRHYPGREVVTLNVDALGEIGGGIHCATQQMPA
ncbi:agmatine deiminase family protein [Kiloniella sp. b19]|uniref:agmatine deiminase family protein n=1 Tax=Kiloniella sp. GXU_MW_B19 TaxID=3141326 RepID=UPI0031D597D0